MSGNKINDPVAWPGMGAQIFDQGINFRVWAPFAERVYVTGSFNQWNKTQHPLTKDEHGYWSIFIQDLKEGEEYKYVIHNGGQELLKNDPYARQIAPESRNTVITRCHFDWNGDDFTIADFNNLVIYELHVGTFSRNKNGKPGNFDGVRAKLDYLKQLGINTIELMPVAAFPSDRSWGYNATNPFAVEESYGGAIALKRLVQEAHLKGIAVIIDVVYNHYGPSDLDLWQFDGWSENGKGGIYFYNDWRAWTPWGENRPDYGRGEVRQFIRDNALSWLEEFHVDGLRFDGVSFIRSVRGYDNDPTNELAQGWSLLQWVNRELQEKFPKAISIAEDLQCNEWITKNSSDGGAGFRAQWDAAFVHPIRAAVIVADDKDRNLESVRNALQYQYNGDAFQRVIYSESHDEVANGRARIPFEIDSSDASGFFAKKRSTLAAGLVFTSPGIPMIFNGQEILEDDWFRDDVPIDWGKLASFRGVNRLYRDLIHLRLNQKGMTAGLTGRHIHVNHLNFEKKVLTFQRWKEGGPGDDVMVVANFSNQAFKDYALGFPRSGMWKVRFNSDWSGYSEDFADFPSIDTRAEEKPLHELACQGLLDIGAYSLIILSQEPVTVENK